MITTHIKRADKFFWWNSSLAICNIFGSSCFGLFFKKSRKVEAVFTFWRTKHVIKCSVTCQSQTKPKTIKTVCWWRAKKKLLERNLTPNLTPIFLSLRLLLVGFPLDMSSLIYAKNFRFDDSRATRFSPRRKRDATGNLLLHGTVVFF